MHASLCQEVRLEVDPSTDLHGAGGRRVQRAEGARRDVGHQAAVVGVIEGVEGIGAELEATLVGELEGLADRQVEVLHTRVA